MAAVASLQELPEKPSVLMVVSPEVPTVMVMVFTSAPLELCNVRRSYSTPASSIQRCLWEEAANKADRTHRPRYIFFAVTKSQRRRSRLVERREDRISRAHR